MNKFFDLSTFSHKSLFDGSTFVWEALKVIAPYLANFSHQGAEFKDAFFKNPELVTIGEGSVVEPGAYIEGPCIIGENCVVRHGAYIRGNVITGDRCIIGHASEVKNSIFLDGAKAPHFNYVGDSILGNDTNLGAGAICANLRFDKKEIVVDNVATGLKKLGLILGDGAQVGCNYTSNPGTLVGKGKILRAKR